VNVWIARTSMLVGKALARSMKARLESKPRARSRARTLNSGTSVVNSGVASITGASFLPIVWMGNAIRIVSKLEARTARAIGCAGSATSSYDTLRNRMRRSRRSQRTTRLPAAWPPKPAPATVDAIWLTQRNSRPSMSFGIS
jgi:hypothetical protein